MADFHILTRPMCPACDRAKAAITIKGMTYDETVHDTPEKLEEFKAKGFRSFPMVFHGETFVGTADQTGVYLRTLKEDGDEF